MAAEYRCFVGKLSEETDDESLKKAFSAHGDVKYAKVVKDRGIGFVSFATEKAMKLAIGKMHGQMLDGRYIVVNEAKPRANGVNGVNGSGPRRDEVKYQCFVGKLAWETDENTLYEAFIQFGKLRDWSIVVDRETRDSRGFGFVDFYTEQSMLDAIEGMNGQELDGHVITVNQAQAGGNGGARPRVQPGYKLFVSGFPKTSDEDTLHRVFQKFGNILLTEVARKRDESTGEEYSRRFGFVTFEKEEAMNAAIHEATTKGKKIDKCAVTVNKAERRRE